jgi:uncharacterized protein (TIGR02001 family)
MMQCKNLARSVHITVHPQPSKEYSMKAILNLVLVTTALTGLAHTAAAAEPESSLSFNVGAVTDYRYRGISQTHLDPALQAGVDYADKSGFYVGAWGSSIKWIKDASGNAPVELDLYGGYKGMMGSTGYDVGFLRYEYANNDLMPNASTNEIYGALSFGVFTAKYSHSISNLFGFADSKNSSYLDLSAAFDLGQGYSLTPHVGYQKVNHSASASYTDYSLTLGKDLGNGLSASLALVGTNADKVVYGGPSGFNGKSGLVAGLKYSF